MAGTDTCNHSESPEWAGREVARLVMLQFSVDQMALEVFMLSANVTVLIILAAVLICVSDYAEDRCINSRQNTAHLGDLKKNFGSKVS
jgi:hypothetical protein